MGDPTPTPPMSDSSVTGPGSSIHGVPSSPKAVHTTSPVTIVPTAVPLRQAPTNVEANPKEAKPKEANPKEANPTNASVETNSKEAKSKEAKPKEANPTPTTSQPKAYAKLVDEHEGQSLIAKEEEGGCCGGCIVA